MDGWNIYLNRDIVKKYKIPFYEIIVSYEQNLNSVDTTELKTVTNNGTFIVKIGNTSIETTRIYRDY